MIRTPCMRRGWVLHQPLVNLHTAEIHDERLCGEVRADYASYGSIPGTCLRRDVDIDTLVNRVQGLFANMSRG